MLNDQNFPYQKSKKSIFISFYIYKHCNIIILLSSFSFPLSLVDREARDAITYHSNVSQCLSLKLSLIKIYMVKQFTVPLQSEIQPM